MIVGPIRSIGLAEPKSTGTAIVPNDEKRLFIMARLTKMRIHASTVYEFVTQLWRRVYEARNCFVNAQLQV